MEHTLKNCPFCSGEASLVANYNHRAGKYFVVCKCSVCNAQGKFYGSKEDPEKVDWSTKACVDAVKAWNMRRGEVQ